MYKPLEPQLSNWSRGKVVYYGFIAMAVVDLISAFVSFFLSSAYSKYTGGNIWAMLADLQQIEAYDNMAKTVQVLQFLIGLGFVVIYLLWFCRAYFNLDRISGGGADHGKWWSLGVWFIPILNMFWPLSMLREMVRRFSGIVSKFPREQQSQIWPASRIDTWVTTAWVLWIVFNIIGGIMNFSARPSESGLSIYDVVSQQSMFGITYLMNILPTVLMLIAISQVIKVEEEVQYIWDSGQFEEKRQEWLDEKERAKGHTELKPGEKWYKEGAGENPSISDPFSDKP